MPARTASGNVDQLRINCIRCECFLIAGGKSGDQPHSVDGVSAGVWYLVNPLARIANPLFVGSNPTSAFSGNHHAGVFATIDLMDEIKPCRWTDVGWVGLFALVLFGFAGISGRPLTMHEARLPETSREMLANHEWLLPTSGGRPWLERPPLPHWLVICAMKLFGHDDRVWIVRLPSAIMGAVTVMMTVLIAGRLFGRATGIVAGCLLATSFKFYQYAVLAEDDIFLAALVAVGAALFTRAEAWSVAKMPLGWSGFFKNRSCPIWFFFVVLGITNIAKGPLLGLVILGGPVGVYLVWKSIGNRTLQPLLRYTWLWGWLLLIGLTMAWPVWAYHRYPDVLENWKYDYLGRMSGDYFAINEPFWYYPPKLFVGLLPWVPACIYGLWIGVRHRLGFGTDARTRAAFQWIICWAIVPLLVLSIPKGKHDHYLVPFLAPWAMLGSVGLIELGKAIVPLMTADAVPTKLRRQFFAVLLLVALGYCGGEAFFAARTDHTVDDTAFLIRVRSEVPATASLFINAKLGPTGNLDFFRTQFYSRSNAVLLHNLSFLRDNTITQPTVYVIDRQRDERLLAQLGKFAAIDQSADSHEMDKKELGVMVGRFKLYKLTFDPNLPRFPKPLAISSLQAMERAPGPWCGPPMQ